MDTSERTRYAETICPFSPCFRGDANVFLKRIQGHPRSPCRPSGIGGDDLPGLSAVLAGNYFYWVSPLISFMIVVIRFPPPSSLISQSFFFEFPRQTGRRTRSNRLLFRVLTSTTAFSSKRTYEPILPAQRILCPDHKNFHDSFFFTALRGSADCYGSDDDVAHARVTPTRAAHTGRKHRTTFAPLLSATFNMERSWIMGC